MQLSVINTEEIKHIPYEEWVLQAQLPDEDCPDCDGKGTTTCYHCGSDMECETCGETGKTVNAKAEYKEQVQKDEKRLKQWVNAVTP